MTATRLVILLLATQTACAPRMADPRATPRPAEFRLELAGQYLVPRGTTVGPDRLVVGGISGLVLDPATGALLGVSDSGDRSRVVVFEMRGEGAAFTVLPRSMIDLSSGAAGPRALDPEALALLEDELVIASEGDFDLEPRVPPGILVYDRGGHFRHAMPVPARFLPPSRGPVTSGVRRNEAFESLTRSPGGARLFTASESPPVQDGAAATLERGAATRILEYVRSSQGDWAPRREFAYQLDPVADGGFLPSFAINGLVELLALSDSDLLALERSFATEGNGGRQLNRIRLYRLSLAGATDVSGVAALGASAPTMAVAKRLVLDLADVGALVPALAALDNFEGIAFGPRLADGNASLVMVSDDNFNPAQQTAFLLFRIVPAANRAATAAPAAAAAGSPAPAAARTARR